ncbi:MAG: aminotransferase class I/II-fold pyridoxal phosphate-dependent enzyme [Acetobacter sp.]|jgi:cystathionine beta-lyase/cystathionine gamma-synthase|nr:aminotransferase class I/II-fold pyridoxal phosphate-dependent enzyme [Acetobacter sp.]MCH4060101.1 aminotransferase class I/II-fold pyridoxal phosphate-dependent enzyme [Acetobacter sp.]MCH4087041.1 aminotransferase class I/II-fold pyridoxal phosphate-dependent enzyme [Acetobacter sp.]MCI1292861.1 aminotransferase class I/II-fold pyridoxal phosphate-dependent enzyme [Acetobacter sp.]MCI1319447.1 aminotransferase class I/II-fold pyridoxal phosphate-dependent enzyme [Acetobacter sp.]
MKKQTDVGPGLSTLSLHAGSLEALAGDSVTQSPNFSTSFHTTPDDVGFSASDLKADTPHFYSRWSNPTLDILEKRLATLEGAEAGLVFASGMAAISGLFFHKLRLGDHLVLCAVCYAGVAELAHEYLVPMGITVTQVDASDPDRLAAAIRPETRLVHVETPANPVLLLTDLQAISQIVHRHPDVALSVDSTIATPIGTRPLDYGADYVIHSLTKYIGGHGDALGGAILGRRDEIAALRRASLIHQGGVLSPFSAWLILRGLETLPLRMKKHEENARAQEAFLADHPAVASVFWPGSPRHPQHDLAKRQMRNYSGLLSFTVKADGRSYARRLAERLRLVSYAVSLGKTKSLIFYIPTDDILRTSFRLTKEDEQLYRSWAGEGVFRVSAGLEDSADLIADIQQALA